MPSKRCFFVVGPEGSGTYMVAEWLSAGGCEYVAEEENLRHILETCRNDNVVIRRSLPHRNRWVDIAEIGRSINFGTDYDVIFIGITRDQFATVQSIQNRSFDITDYDVLLLSNRRSAIAQISSIVLDFRGEIITYESMVNNEAFRRRFWAHLGLEWHDYPEDYKFYNGNLKYYE